MHFLMIDDKGNPNTAEEYRDAVETRYGLAYTIKLMSRKTLGRVYVVPPLEGLSKRLALRTATRWRSLTRGRRPRPAAHRQAPPASRRPIREP
jgi:hypothetical protein